MYTQHTVYISTNRCTYTVYTYIYINIFNIFCGKSCAGRAEMSSLCVVDALVGGATAPCGRKGPSDKSMVSPAACQNQRVTSALRRTVSPATPTKIHKRMEAERTKLLLLFSSLFNCAVYARQCLRLFPRRAMQEEARQWASTLGRWAGSK